MQAEGRGFKSHHLHHLVTGEELSKARYLTVPNIVCAIIRLLCIIATASYFGAAGYGTAGTLGSVIGWLIGAAIVMFVKNLWNN